jgi:RHS repeat-associated protein
VISPGIPTRYSFTGREFDTETGLYYFRARYTDPRTGRFLSEDPNGLGGGDHNLYRYVGNSPTNATDPTGEFFVPIIAAAVGGLVGGIVAYVVGGSVVQGAISGAIAGLTGGLLGPLVAGAFGGGVVGAVVGGAVVGAVADATVQGVGLSLGWQCSYNLRQTVTAAGLGAAAGLVGRLRTPTTGGPTLAAPTPSPGPPVHSRYADGTPVFEGRQPPRISGPEASARGYPHTVLRWDPVNGRLYQGREFGPGNIPIRDVDFTNPTFPNGTVRPGHPGPPHQHPWIPNNPNNPRAGYRRGGPEPLQ